MQDDCITVKLRLQGLIVLAFLGGHRPMIRRRLSLRRAISSPVSDPRLRSTLPFSIVARTPLAMLGCGNPAAFQSEIRQSPMYERSICVVSATATTSARSALYSGALTITTGRRFSLMPAVNLNGTRTTSPVSHCIEYVI